LRHSRQMDLGFVPKTDKISMVLDLSGGSEDIWSKKLHSNVRNKIRKSEKMGVELKQGPEFLRPFYEMHLMNMQELGSPAHSLRFFEEAIKALKDKIKVYAAFVDGKVVGGKIVCYSKETVYFLWVSSPRKYLKYAAVSLMDWAAIKDAADAGTRFCDFGRSTTSSTHYEFKKKWGGEARQLYWHVYPEHAGREDGNASKKYNLFSKAWQRMPLLLVRAFGPWLRKGLPQ
jgi:lipid II:glycine glycyltransferase (peptidoglycan interpeptide bridge formation enzyme)